jgi:mutator protein MutT
MPTVVAALILHESKLLVCQRRRDDSNPLKWEFPGGKVERGESHADALARELREELGVEAAIGGEVFRTGYRYKELKEEFLLIFFRANVNSPDSLQNLVFERFEWSELKALPKYDFLQADKDLVVLLASGSMRLD